MRLVGPRFWIPPGPDRAKTGSRRYYRHEPDPVNAAAIEKSGVLWGYKDQYTDIPSVDAN
jgi:hypothetical protein